jgi:ABC-type nitrate/sulfonate/bicarbonate transport system substrate-binding protein
MRFFITIMMFLFTTQVYAQTGFPDRHITLSMANSIAPSAHDWPYLIAEQKRLFEKQNIKVKLVLLTKNQEVASMVGRGESHFAFQMIIVDAMIVNKKGFGIDFERINNGAFLAMFGKSDNLKDIKTITISTKFEPSYFFAREILKSKGENPDKFQYINAVNGNQRLQYVLLGRVDAGIMPIPRNFIAYEKGFKHIAYVHDILPEYPFQALAINSEFKKNNPEIAKKLIHIWDVSIVWLKNNKQEASEILSKWMQISIEDAEKTYDLIIKYNYFSTTSKNIQTRLDSLNSYVQELINTEIPQ